jgi:hypothetical protein
VNRGAHFDILENGPKLLVVRDLGPWDKYLTITNAAEEVVEDLFKTGILNDGQTFQYYDSEGELTEIVHKDGKFVGFCMATTPDGDRK